MSRSRQRLAGLWLLMGLFACACSKPSRLWVEKLDVDAFEGGEVASISKELLEQWLAEKLGAAKFKVASSSQKIPAEAKPWRLQLAAGLSEPDLERQTAAVAVVLELRQVGANESFSVDSRVQVTAGENDVEALQSAIRGALQDALGRVTREAAALITLETSSAPQLREKLGDADGAVRDGALRLLVRRHDEAAVAPLLERLKTDDLDVLRGVIGLLVELKAPASVNPLINAANQRGPLFAREVVFAVGAIGGDDAEAYLDLVASGHDDPLLRASAEQALKELRARKPKPSPGEDP